MHMRTRLETLRTRLTMSWIELQKKLDISESTLYFLRTGARKPSPALLRKIVALEIAAGITHPEPQSQPHPIIVKETPPPYGKENVSISEKTLHDQEIVATLDHVIAELDTLRRLLIERRNTNQSGKD